MDEIPRNVLPSEAIDGYLDRACGSLGLSAGLREHIRDELRAHLLDAVEGHMAHGLSRPEAVSRAIEEIGDPAEVAAGLKGVYGRHVVRLLIEKAMEWKERTMKSSWKWSFVAHLMLAIVLVAEVLFILGASSYIFPLVAAEYESLDLELPAYCQTTLSVVRWFFWQQGLPLLGVCLLALALFEWRYRGDEKPLVRLALGGTVAVALMALVWAVAISMSVPHVQLYFQRNDERAAAVALREAVAAETAYGEIRRAMAAGRPDEASAAARRLRTSLAEIERSRGGILGLAALERASELGHLRELVRELADSARAIEALGHQSAEVEARRLNARLEASYARLTQAAQGWPKVEDAPNAIPEEGR
jgi:hypothetical protein